MNIPPKKCEGHKKIHLIFFNVCWVNLCFLWLLSLIFSYYSLSLSAFIIFSSIFSHYFLFLISLHIFFDCFFTLFSRLCISLCFLPLLFLSFWLFSHISFSVYYLSLFLLYFHSLISPYFLPQLQGKILEMIDFLDSMVVLEIVL